MRDSSALPWMTSWRRAASSEAISSEDGDVAAHEPDRAGDRVGVDAAGRRDVEHRRLRERADDLVRRGQHGVGALLERRRRQVGVEAEVRAPRLVDHQRHARGVGDLGAARDVGGHPVVGRRDDPGRARLRRGGQRRLERGRRHAVRHAELLAVLGRDVARPPARQHEAVDHRRVRVALHDQRRAERGEREAERVVALAGAVGQEPRARRAVGLGGELLGALERRRLRPEVDAVDVLRDVEHQRVLADRGDQPGVRARAGLVAGDVEARGAAEAVGHDGVEVGRGRLVGGDDLTRADRDRRVGVVRDRHRGPSPRPWPAAGGRRARSRRGRRRARGWRRPSPRPCGGP